MKEQKTHNASKKETTKSPKSPVEKEIAEALEHFNMFD